MNDVPTGNRQESAAMSGPDDVRPPRKPRPKAEAPRGPSRDDGSGLGPSTFRPNPNAGTPKRPAARPLTDMQLLKGPTWAERILFGRVSSGQLAAFCRQFAAYMGAGVDIGKSLVNLQKQFAGTSLGPVIGRLSVAVKRGDSFAEAVAREPQAFDALFVGMMRVAEARGGIPETLKSLGRHYENRQSLIRQARSAMIYPAAVLVAASAVVALLTLWILPMFITMLRESGGTAGGVPLPTRLLMAFSDFVQRAGWLVIPVVLVGTPFLVLMAYRSAAGKRVMDRAVLYVPVFGSLLKKLDTSRFARTLSTLLDAGVDIGSSLELASDVVTLDPFRGALRDVRTKVMHGTELSTSLGESGRFGPDVIAVVASGEETGKLPETLDHLADDYEEQVAYMVRNMGQLVQPLLMVAMGLLVLFIILAVFLPYLNVIRNLANGL